MRLSFPFAASAALALALLGGCADTTSRAIGGPSENVDPSQVRMLPDNPYQSVRPPAASATKLP
jgi:hypothetical protein